MIRRIARSLRAHAFLLIALLGVALLLAGAVEWWRFYRDLYVEERSALSQLAEVAGGSEVSYVRTGSPADEWSLLVNAPPTPWGAPFVGRIEAVRADVDDASRPELSSVRERVLALPGLTAYFEYDWPNDVPAPHRLDLAQALGRPLPPFVPSIDETELEDPIPRGEPLEGDAATNIWNAVRGAWIVDRRIDRPYLAVLDNGYLIAAEVRDGDRRWTYSSQPSDPFAEEGEREFEEEVNLTQLGVTQSLRTRGDQWQMTERGPCRWHGHLEESELAQDRVHLGPDALKFSAQHVAQVLQMTSVERIDEARYRLTFAPCEAGALQPAQFESIEVVVRSDMNWALERSRLRYQFLVEEPQRGPSPCVAIEIRRLDRVGDVIYRAESLQKNVQDGYAAADVPAERERFALELYPRGYDAAFDLGTYGVRPWRDPTPLPTLRAYRLLVPFGGVLIVLGTTGLVAQRLRPRRRKIGDSSRDPARTGGATSPRPALRFGFVTLGSAALLMISVAGWCKSHLDPLREENYLLGACERASTVQREAHFPFSILSTETFPLDAPLRHVEVAVPTIDVRDRLLKLPEIETYNGVSGYDLYSPKALPQTSLGASTPTLPPLTIQDTDLEGPLPRGEALSSEETRELSARLLEVWKKAAASKPPLRYVVRGERRTPRDFDGRIELRDGPRFWKAFAGTERRAKLACGDETWEYRYSKPDDPRLAPASAEFEWSLVARFPSGDESMRQRYPLPESPALPSFFAALGSDLLSETLAAKLSRDPTLVNVLHAERLDDDRYRLELEPPRIPLIFRWDNYEYTPWKGTFAVSRWSLIVNETLGWSIEASEVETITPARWRSEEGEPYDRMTSNTISRTETIGGQTLLVESRTRVSGISWSPSEEPFEDYSARYAYDFSPTIDERIFRVPSLDYPYPPPDPVPPPLFQWWMATALIAGGGFVVAGIGRLRSARRRPTSESEAKESGAAPHEAPEPYAGKGRRHETL
ncbi:MAG TPA: hypothetical protein VGN57_18445 [Pirellulaceae bacterium]|nr:hypothetical protein [Pirellulaceae bacterium]